MDAEHDPGVAEARRRGDRAAAAARRPLRFGDGEVRTGTASWTDPTMTAAGVFYPEGASGAEERLRHYASQFPLVEVDSTYYALPQPKLADAWAARTPDHFVFDVKAHALMTGQPSETARLPKAMREALPAALAARRRIYGHDLPAELRDEMYESFREALAPLVAAGKLGAVLLQFPKWVFPTGEAREAILAAREGLRLPVVVEFRHGSWFNEKNAERTVHFLEDNRLPYVAVDEPQGFRSSMPPVVVPTSPELAVFRFHGRNDATWEKSGITPAERFQYLYDEDQLADWAPQIARVARQTRQTHVVMNNCFSNYGTTNAREIARLLEDLQGPL